MQTRQSKLWRYFNAFSSDPRFTPEKRSTIKQSSSLPQILACRMFLRVCFSPVRRVSCQSLTHFLSILPDLTYNNSDLIPEKKKNRLQKHKKKRRKKKRRRHRKRNKKRRRRPKDRRKKRKKFRKRKKSRLNIRKKKLRIYKEAWKQFCQKDVVYIHVNSILQRRE